MKKLVTSRVKPMVKKQQILMGMMIIKVVRVVRVQMMKAALDFVRK